jgi:parallel beta-helix repeat protein
LSYNNADKKDLSEVIEMKKLIFAFTCLFLAIPCQARIITVDDDGYADFNNIQAAINDSNDGDTILVADGIYTGDGNRDIDFGGRAITVSSENGPNDCIIDCEGTSLEYHRGFYFHSGENANSILDGFTIRNGYQGNGGGIRFTGSSPHIINCVITNNTAPLIPGFPGYFATDGGGILSEVSSPTIDNCIISDNTATASGGGIYSYKGNPIINNCTISGNAAGEGGY